MMNRMYRVLVKLFCVTVFILTKFYPIFFIEVDFDGNQLDPSNPEYTIYSNRIEIFELEDYKILKQIESVFTYDFFRTLMRDVTAILWFFAVLFIIISMVLEIFRWPYMSNTFIHLYRILPDLIALISFTLIIVGDLLYFYSLPDGVDYQSRFAGSAVVQIVNYKLIVKPIFGILLISLILLLSTFRAKEQISNFEITNTNEWPME